MLDHIPQTDEAEGLLWAHKTSQKILNSEFLDTDLTVVTPDLFTLDRFTLACLAADWASYTKPEDKADFPRLAKLIKAFPSGFRVYFSKLASGEHLPVGYTGWYPIAQDVFDTLEQNPSNITHRGFMQAVPMAETNYIYLFNYSLAPHLIGTKQSADLVKDFAASLSDVSKSGMAAVTVSPHGARIAEKFGMRLSGQMSHDGDIENVYTLRL